MKNKKLTKSKNKILLGVCGGIAEFLDWPRKTVRGLWIVLTLLGLGIFVYPILAFFMPGSNSGNNGFNIDDYRAE